MSEFKFACPVCGQHITADSSATGSPLECPTCFRKIVVPQAPASADPKFILSASEANKPRPPRTNTPVLEPVKAEPSRKIVPIALAALLVGMVAGAALFALRGKIFKSGSDDQNLAGEPAEKTNAGVAANDVKPPPAPPTNSVAWSLDLSGAVFPEAPPAGRIRGEYVSCNRATVVGGALGFRQGVRGLPDLSVTVYLFARQPEDFQGKTFAVTTNDSKVPRVAMRWKEGRETRTQWFTNGYALKLEAGTISGNRLAGKIYLSLPDEKQTRLAGSFNAEIRKPAPPKPRPAK